MAHEHSHAVGGNEKALRWALLLTSIYLVAEVVGGLVSGSLALLSDAAHMFTDTVALANEKGRALAETWVTSARESTGRLQAPYARHSAIQATAQLPS